MIIKKKSTFKKPIFKLDPYEQEIENALYNDNFVSVKNVEKEKAIAKQAATNYLRKEARINIRLSKIDLEKIKQKAVYEGLPYQTLIASILHKYAANNPWTIWWMDNKLWRRVASTISYCITD